MLIGTFDRMTAALRNVPPKDRRSELKDLQWSQWRIQQWLIMAGKESRILGESWGNGFNRRGSIGVSNSSAIFIQRFWLVRSDDRDDAADVAAASYKSGRLHHFWIQSSTTAAGRRIANLSTSNKQTNHPSVSTLIARYRRSSSLLLSVFFSTIRSTGSLPSNDPWRDLSACDMLRIIQAKFNS